MALQFLLGQNPPGASTFVQPFDQLGVCQFTLTGLTISVTQIRLRANAASATTKVKGVIYASDASNNPTTLLGVTNELTGIVINENILTFPAPIVLPAGKYFIGYHVGTANLPFYNSTSTGINAYQTRTYASGVPNPFGAPLAQTGQRAIQAWGDFFNPYPLGLTIVNPGGEAGDGSGWVSGGSLGASNVLKRSGTYALAGLAVANVDGYQDLTFPESYHADIDTALLTANVNFYQAGTDLGRTRVELLDGSDIVVRSHILPPLASGPVWIKRQIREALPSGIRKIRIRVLGERSAGAGNCLTYWDDAEALICYPASASLLDESNYGFKVSPSKFMLRSNVRTMNGIKLLKNVVRFGRSYFTVVTEPGPAGEGETNFNNGFN